MVNGPVQFNSFNFDCLRCNFLQFLRYTVSPGLNLNLDCSFFLCASFIFVWACWMLSCTASCSFSLNFLRLSMTASVAWLALTTSFRLSSVGRVGCLPKAISNGDDLVTFDCACLIPKSVASRCMSQLSDS